MFLRFVVLLTACLFCLNGSCKTGLGQNSKLLVIEGGHYFDTDAATFKPNDCIVIQDGKFSLVNVAVEPVGSQVIRLNDDHYLLPGLIDCHAHYNVRLLRNRREEFNVMPIQYLANGVTATFSCGEYDPERMLKLRKDIESGGQIGPKLLNSGPYFGRARRPWNGDPEQVREEVDFWAAQGVGGFKAKGIDANCLKALIEQAHKHGLTVTGHLGSGAGSSVNPRDAIDMGIDRIEHFLGGDAMTADQPAYSTLAGIRPDMPEFKAIVQKFIDNKIYFDATITAYGYFGPRDGEIYEQWFDESSLFTDYVRDRIKQRNSQRPRRPSKQFQQIFETKRQTIDDYFRAGGLITMGTDHVSDSSYLPGFGSHREMMTMVRAGIPEADVIKIATINGARALGIDDQHGSISVGKIADLAIVEGNPLDEIKNTRNVRYVVRAGQVHDPKKLLESVKGMLGPADDEQASEW